MSSEIHLNDIGTVFELSIKDSDGSAVDITTATSLKVIFLKPDGTLDPKTVAAYGAGTNGVIRYTTIADDLDQIGKYKLQAQVAVATGTWKSNIQSFKVLDNL